MTTPLEWLERAETTSGQAYVEARDELLRHGHDALPLLRTRGTLTAEMIATHLTDAPLVARVHALMRGELRTLAPTPVSGSWSPDDRAAAIIALGPAAFAPTLEALVKTHAYADDDQCETLFAALRLWRDPRAVTPLIALLDRRNGAMARLFAAHTLGRLGAEPARPALESIAADEQESERLRETARSALAWIAKRAAG